MVTGVGSNIGQGIVKALRMSGLGPRIIGTDIVAMSAGLFRSDKGYLVPRADSPEWLDRIIEICSTEKVDIVFAGSDTEIPFFAASRDKIEREAGCLVLVSNEDVVKATDDKWETAQFLKRYGLNCPVSFLGLSLQPEEIMSRLKFPMVVKPRKGAGSRDVFIVRNGRELECALCFVKDSLIQEYIAGDEFTSGVFFDKRSSVKGVITMKRDLQFGTTYRAVIDDFPEVKSEVLRVVAALSKDGALGPMNIQTRHFEGRTYTLEINPRFSGTTVFRAKFNVNEPEMAVRHFLFGEEVPELKPTAGIVMRYWEEVYASAESLAALQRDGSLEKAPSDILPLF